MRNDLVLVRRSGDRGRFDFGWLKTAHSFSFGDYHDLDWMGFSDLRVINEDHVAPGAGFPLHPHRDMEILTWVLAGAIEHRDSLGNGAVLRPGEIQRMSAGAGIRHSEANPSATETLHLLQIWILPAQRGGLPSYEQKAVDPASLEGRFGLVAGPRGSGAVVDIHQDARLWIGRIPSNFRGSVDLAPSRAAWVQVAKGSVRIGSERLEAGDALGCLGHDRIEVEAERDAEVLVFDLRGAEDPA